MLIKVSLIVGIILSFAIAGFALAAVTSGDLCSKKFEEPLDPLCQGSLDCLEKCKILRDTKRRMDLSQIKAALEGWTDSLGVYHQGYKDDYKKYPLLEAGTYIKNVTLSNWPSWKDLTTSLASQLKKYLPFLSIDPIQPAGLQSKEEYQKDPKCPIYKYEALKDGQEYKLYYFLEREGKNKCNLTYFVGESVFPLETDFQFFLEKDQSKKIEQGDNALYKAEIASKNSFNQPVFFEVINSPQGIEIEPNVPQPEWGISPPVNKKINFEIRIKSKRDTPPGDYQLEIKAKSGKIFHSGENKLKLVVEEAPFSWIETLSSYQASDSFKVAWQGKVTGSGIKHFNIQYKDGKEGEWQDWILKTDKLSAVFDKGKDGHTYCFRSQVESNIGNLEPYPGGNGDTCTLVDLSSPKTSDNIQDKWFQSFEVVFIASDGENGSGIDKTYYTFDGTTPDVNSLSGNRFVLDQEGEYLIKYFSTDRAGNKEEVKTATNKVKIDKTSPEIEIISPKNGEKIKDQNTLKVSVNASDVRSGIKKIEIYNGEELLAKEKEYNWNIQNLTDRDYTIKAKVSDRAENVREASIKVTINHCGNNQLGELEQCDSQKGFEGYQCIGGGEIQCQDCQRICSQGGEIAQCGQGTAKLSGEISDVMAGKLEGAKVELKDKKDYLIKSVTTGSNGLYSFEDLSLSHGQDLCGYKLVVSKSGYRTVESEFFFFEEDLIKNFGLVREGLRDGTRIVLRWGSSPADLDSHLKFSNVHIYYNNTSSNGASLDRDDINGEGPETITINPFVKDTTYKYYIKNYSYTNRGCGCSFGSAEVRVFDSEGNQVGPDYSVPSGIARYWNVLEINGSTGQVTVINKLTDSEP